jgi:hypothetical protein
MRTTWISLTLVATLLSLAGAAAERHWQTGKWADVTTKRRIVDFGPGASGFGRPGSTPQMQAMADIRRFVIETDDLHLEIEDTVSVGRRTFDAVVGGLVTFALEKNTVYVRDADHNEHKLKLIKKMERSAADASPVAAAAPAYAALGGGHVLRGVTEKGRYVTLEDGSRWEVSADDHFKTADWEAAANITVRTLPRPESGFLYELINTSADEGAIANHVR